MCPVAAVGAEDLTVKEKEHHSQRVCCREQVNIQSQDSELYYEYSACIVASRWMQ